MEEDGNGCDDTEAKAREEETDSNLHAVSLSIDAILSLLADHQRRDLLRYLIDSSDQTAAHEEIVRHILKREEERSGECPGHDHVEASLHHVHLPKLEDTGVLEYDSRSQELRYWGHDELETWLDRIEAGESESN